MEGKALYVYVVTFMYGVCLLEYDSIFRRLQRLSVHILRILFMKARPRRDLFACVFSALELPPAF